MKLENIAEAVWVLEDLTNTFASESAQNRKLALSIQNARELLHECYMQMSRRVAELGDVQLAKEFEDLAREQLQLFQWVSWTGFTQLS